MPYLNLMLTKEHELLRETLRSFSEKELKPLAREIDETEGFHPEVFKKIGDLGLLGVTVSEAYGGGGMDVLAATLAMEEFGRVCASTALSYLAHSILCVNNIYANGTEEQKKKYLPPLCSGEKLGAMAMTEPGYGSDAMGMETKAVKEGKFYKLTGRKMFITNGTVAQTLVVYAKTGSDREVSSFIVEKDFPGFSVGKKLSKLGMRGSPTSELIFEDCKVPENNVLGKLHQGIPQMKKTLDIERITISGISVGIAQAALEDSISYAKDRKQFKTPIIEFQLVQKMLADMYTWLEAARRLTYHAAMVASSGKKATALASACKVYASEIATQASLHAIQILGGYGYCKDYNVERYLRDAKLMEIGAGTSEVQRMIIAKELAQTGLK
ncbi:MAG: acyl-CoA dehydrogenase family protein [Deltaproteobacteria bacterium]|nr:acyl-CoA dehydrogenase family protein [Deltaproteobacteria bacterium]